MELEAAVSFDDLRFAGSANIEFGFQLASLTCSGRETRPVCEIDGELRLASSSVTVNRIARIVFPSTSET